MLIEVEYGDIDLQNEKGVVDPVGAGGVAHRVTILSKGAIW